MKHDHKRHAGRIFLIGFTIFAFLFAAHMSLALTKEDYLRKDYQYCGITECYTQYTLKNPTGESISTETLGIDEVIEYRGAFTEMRVVFWNGTGWEDIEEIKPERSGILKERNRASLDRKRTHEERTIRTGESHTIRVYGKLTPSYTSQGISYAVDHIPSYAGFQYEEHDLWNQSYNKCVDINVTYDLNTFGEVNEMFPVRLDLNETFINTSTIRADWGDLRFGNGTCANVTSDYTHNLVFTNSTNARAIIYVDQGAILNNTPVPIAAYYNNTQATHPEPAASETGMEPSIYRIFTHDTDDDTDNTSYTATNDTSAETLTTFNIATLTGGGQYGNTKLLSGNSSLVWNLTEAIDEDTPTGWAGAFNIIWTNTTQPQTQYLAVMGNESDLTNTAIFELYYTAGFGGASSGSIDAYWNYDDNVEDSAGSRDWTNTGTSNLPNGIINEGRTGDGDNLNQEWDITGWSEITVGMMVRVHDHFDQSFVWRQDIDAGQLMGLRVHDVSGLIWIVSTTGGNGRVDGFTDEDKWYCVVATAEEGGNLSIYVNKTLSETEALPGGGFTMNDATMFALENDGDIDEMFVSNSVWTQEEVDAYCDFMANEISYPFPQGQAQLDLVGYFDDGTQTVTADIGTPVEGVSYPVGFSVRRSSLSGSYMALVFNGSVLADDHLPDGGGFRQNTSTNCDNDVCADVIAFGGEYGSTVGEVVTSISNPFNGSIDEIIIGGTGTGNTSKMGAPFLYTWGVQPEISFSPNLVSNLFIPVITLSLNPDPPQFIDNSTASVNYTDGDADNGTVFFQWRVNGTLVREASYFVEDNDVVQDTLSSGNYSKGSILNVTTWANDSLYTTANESIQVTVTGIKPDPVTDLSCSAHNKTAINCTWTNPSTDFLETNLYLNGSFTANVSNLTTSYQYGGLLPGLLYNLTLRTESQDNTEGNDTTNLTTTVANPPPNITNFTPTNLTPFFEENTTETFTVNATDDDGSPLITWFLDGIKQVTGAIFNWDIGLQDQGNHTVTAVVNDTWGATVNQTWNVTVNDTFPAPQTPEFNPDGGTFRTYIPVKCVSRNFYNAVSFYKIEYETNNGSWKNLSKNNTLGYVQFDITQFDYGTNFTFRCTAYGEAGNSTNTSETFTRDFVNEFYSTYVGSELDLVAGNEYVMSLYYDAQNPRNNISVLYAYSDCNGDGLYDYVYNFTSLKPNRIKRYYTCVFPPGSVQYEVGVHIEKRDDDTWEGSGCSEELNYKDTCTVRKRYNLQVT